MTEKNNPSARLIFAICFLVLMSSLGAASIATGFVLLKHRLTSEPQRVSAIQSFVERYPFENDADSMEQRKSAHSSRNFFANLRSAIIRCTAQYNPLTNSFCRVARHYDEIVGNDLFENGKSVIIRLPNGYFTDPFIYSHPTESWARIADFSRWLKGKGIRFLTLLPSVKCDDSITVFPPVIPHGYARIVEEYTSFLTKSNVPFLDSKRYLLAENSDFYSWFYKADHHWNARAGRAIAKVVAETINNDFGIDTDFDAAGAENFTRTVYPNSFRGSFSQRTGAPPEDMEVFYPKEEGTFHIEIPSRGIDQVGRFKDALIVQSRLSGESSYSAFLHGDQPLIRIENSHSPNASRILVIKTSSADVLCPYLACTVRYLDIIDPRHFDGSIRSFIEQSNPDVVMTCSCPPYEGDEDFWRLK